MKIKLWTCRVSGFCAMEPLSHYIKTHTACQMLCQLEIMRWLVACSIPLNLDRTLQLGCLVTTPEQSNLPLTLILIVPAHWMQHPPLFFKRILKTPPAAASKRIPFCRLITCFILRMNQCHKPGWRVMFVWLTTFISEPRDIDGSKPGCKRWHSKVRRTVNVLAIGTRWRHRILIAFKGNLLVHWKDGGDRQKWHQAIFFSKDILHWHETYVGNRLK